MQQLAGLSRAAPESQRGTKKFADRFQCHDACGELISLLVRPTNTYVQLKAIDLLEKLLRWLPSERISAERALEHEFVQPFRVVDGETALPGRFDDPNSGAVLSPDQWRDLIRDEIQGSSLLDI